MRAREQRLHRFGQNMRKVVPGKVERIGLIARRDERQLHIRVQGAGDIAQIAIHARGYGGLGKAGANGGSNISRRCAFWHFPNGTIG